MFTVHVLYVRVWDRTCLKGAVSLFQLISVNFDNHIPNWHTQLESIPYNVLSIVKEGKVRYDINGDEVIGERSDALFIPQSTRRAGGNWMGTAHQKFTILFAYDNAPMTGIPFLDQARFAKFRMPDPLQVFDLCGRLHEEMRGGKSYRTFICLGLFQELVGTLAREMEKSPELTPSKLKYAETIKKHLLAHYRDQIEIEQLAGLVGLTPNYVTAMFKEVCGHSPIRYMHRLRILEACGLLLGSTMTVADIAQYLGYYDTSYFCRMFKQLAGMSPTEYAKRGDLSETSKLLV